MEMTPEQTMAHLGRVFDARDAAYEGRYCECSPPNSVGTICDDCGLCVRSIEVDQVLAIVRAHDFVSDERHPHMCAVCSNWEDNPRHHGTDAVGQLRDGTPVRP